jgi:hypothetical protein
MRRSFFAALIAILAPAAFAQLDSNTITVSASRAIYVQPDQIAIGVYVDTGLDARLDQVLAAVQPAGLSATNFSSVYPTFSSGSGSISSGPPDGLEWAFTIYAPFASMKDTLKLLASVQQTVAKQTFGITLTFGLQGLQVSPQAQAAQACNTQDLMRDARAQALALANAAGFGIGPVVALSDGSGLAATSIGAVAPSATVAYLVDFSSFSSFRIGQDGIINSILTSRPTCEIVVKFRLTQM